MTDSTLNRFLSYGTNAQRLAFTPSVPTPASGPSQAYIWYETDTLDTYCYAAGAWHKVDIGGGASALTLLEQHTASASASLNFTAAISSTYDEYMIEFLNLIPATNAINFYMRMSTDGGATYDSGANYSYVAFGLNRFGSAPTGVDSGGTQIQLNKSAIDNTSTAGISGSIRLFNPGSTSVHKNITGQLNGLTGGALEIESVTGWYRSTTAVNAFQFLTSSGNITSGTIRVYGVAKT